MIESLTYRELRNVLNQVSEKQLDQNVTVFVAPQDEMYPVGLIETSSDKQDILDPGHLVLIVREYETPITQEMAPTAN